MAGVKELTSMDNNELGNHAPDAGETIADQRAGPGIVVLSTAMQLLHMNRQAAELKPNPL